MTVAAERADEAVENQPASGIREWMRREHRWIAPSLVAGLNALAFALIAPNVNDIFAAIARENAVLHHVGLKYWFSWYGGGSTPGNYSVVTPYLSALVGAVQLAAVATAAITPLAWLALRGTAHPVAGLWIVTVTAGLNLWSGRVPFALGCLMAVATVVFVMRRRAWPAALFAVLSVACSPVSGAFLLLGLAGLFLTRPDWRRTCVLAALPIAAALLAVAIVFGQPGPESFSIVQLLQLLAALCAFFIAAPPSWVRAAIGVTLLAAPAIFVIPNGLGDNVLRFATYCLPGVVVATSPRRLRTALLAASVALVLSSKQTIGDVFAGAQPTASPHYYDSLIAKLINLRPQLMNCRLEVVEDGTHTASSTLPDHAMLARGYEYQEDNALNKVLAEPHLDATTYKIWLQDNAVCYVALSSTKRKPSPEYTLVSQNPPDYLSEIWTNDDWTLYEVANPNPIVDEPVEVVGFTQSELVLRVPCACRFGVRVRKPENLRAETTPRRGSSAQPVEARLEPDGFGWTTMTTTRPGVYTLSGK